MARTAMVVISAFLLAFSTFGKDEPFYPEAVSRGGSGSVHSFPATDEVTWTQMPNSINNFGRSGAGKIGNYLYFFGGFAANYAQAFNLTNNRWEISNASPIGNGNWGSATTGNALFLIGGFSVLSGYHNNVQRFVPNGSGPLGTWTQMAPFPHAAGGVAAAWDGGDCIYAAGGIDAMAYPEAYVYRISDNTWTPIAPMPMGMGFCGGAFVCGKFHVMGGTSSGPNHFAYDPANNQWTEQASVPTPLWFGTFAVTFNESYIIAVGGGGGYLEWPATNAVQIYNPADNSWTQETVLPMSLGLNTARWVGNGTVISAGGYLNNNYLSVTYKGTGFPGGALPLAPAAPTNFTVSHNGPVLMASLQWTNPATTVNGQLLTAISAVHVERFGVPLATLTGTPGQTMTYSDTLSAPGMQYYSVYCTNSAGDGLKASNGAWIGLDVPGAPTGVTSSSPAPQQAAVSWTAPSIGAHGGYWPEGSWIGQKIYRNSALCATLNGTNTTYNDNVPYAGYYTYAVSYFNASGEGPSTAAPQLQIQGPQQYTAISIPFYWVEINPSRPGALPGINTNINGDDQNLGPFPLGFSFPYFSGSSYNGLRICSNGFASFTATVNTFSNFAIPTATEPNNLLAIYWDDLNLNPSTGGHGAVYYYHDTANNRFIAEWDSIPHYSAPPTPNYFTFEIILHTDGTIDYLYKSVVPGAISPFPSATVGIENSNGMIGIQCTYNGSGPIEPAPNTGIRFQTPSATPPDLNVTLTPLNPPITVPAAGGSFSFTATVQRVQAPQSPFYVWSRDRFPDGTYSASLLGPVQINPPVGQQVTRLREQNVPGTWPGGIHWYIGYANPTVAYPAVDADSFSWTKLTTGANGPGVWDATCTGEPFPGEEIPPLSRGDRGDLVAVSPNPFNPTTALSYELRAASYVSLRVYDTAGRLVSTLVEGMQEAGQHSVTFDGSKLASGLYFVRMQAGDYTAVQKLMLLK